MRDTTTLSRKSIYAKIFAFCFVSYLLTNVFANLGEVIDLMEGSLFSQQLISTPLSIRFVRELLFVCLYVVPIQMLAHSDNRIAFPLYLFTLLFLLTISLVTSILDNAAMFTVLSGIRWALPLFLPVFAYRFIDQRLMITVAKTILVLFTIHIILQITQYFIAPSWFGLNRWGFSARSPGIFLLPNTAAFFSIISGHILKTELFRRKITRVAVLIVTFASVMLTSSGTGLIVLFVYLVVEATPKRIHRSVLVLLPAIVGFGLLILWIAPIGRPANYVSVSGGTRLRIVLDAIDRANLVSSDFGAGTNTAVLVNQNLNLRTNGRVVDSFVASVIINWGLSGLIAFFFVSFTLFVTAIAHRNKTFSQIMIITLLFSMTTIITESRPAGILSIVMIVATIKRDGLHFPIRNRLRAPMRVLQVADENVLSKGV